MIFSDDRTTRDALLHTLGDGLAAAWARFYAIEVDSRPGEPEYDRALAAAKKLEAATVEIVAAAGGRPEGDWPF
jgi:CelD/BcsL family acetyltransferase involved in cellulose biosynthesis